MAATGIRVGGGNTNWSGGLPAMTISARVSPPLRWTRPFISRWLPFWLWWLDELYERYEGVDVETLSAPPSELFRRQCFVSADPGERTLPQVLQLLGDDNVVFASDYPHPDGIFPGVVAALADRADVSDADKAKILGTNAGALFGL